QFAVHQQLYWPATTGVVYREFYPDLWTIAYFNPQVSWIGMPGVDLAKLEAYRADFEHTGRALWLDDAMHEAIGATPEGKSWLTSHVDRQISASMGRPLHTFRYYLLGK